MWKRWKTRCALLSSAKAACSWWARKHILPAWRPWSARWQPRRKKFSVPRARRTGHSTSAAWSACPRSKRIRLRKRCGRRARAYPSSSGRSRGKMAACSRGTTITYPMCATNTALSAACSPWVAWRKPRQSCNFPTMCLRAPAAWPTRKASACPAAFTNTKTTPWKSPATCYCNP